MGIAITTLAASFLVGIVLSRKYSEKKLIIWGLVTMLSIAPFFTWIVATLYGISEENGWAAMAVMWVMFPAVFLVGIGMLSVGVYKAVTGSNL